MKRLSESKQAALRVTERSGAVAVEEDGPALRQQVIDLRMRLHSDGNADIGRLDEYLRDYVYPRLR